MNQEIIRLASRKFQELEKKYNRFITVIVDDWRGPRFVFDTKDVRQCKNNCNQCPLFWLLKNEKAGLFSAGLYPASEKDKKLFGPQRFLNCKTIIQYENCYVNFLVKEANSEKEILDELDLIKNLRILFSTKGSAKMIERKFKKGIIRRALLLADDEKKKIIDSNFNLK